MEAKFHRETAKIYDFVLAARPIGREQLAPNLAVTNVVPIRSKAPSPPRREAAQTQTRTDAGSGWYHGAAIHDAEPFRH